MHSQQSWKDWQSVERNERGCLDSQSDSDLSPVSINQLETQMGQIFSHLNSRQQGGLPSDTMENLKNEALMGTFFMSRR